jgi:N-dimethylarginine dimethylaminohydrolase
MKLLMCPPDHFDVTYEINAWMRIAARPDAALAGRQWRALHTLLTDELGADVALVSPQESLPDMVFTANAGLVSGRTFVPSRFRFAERQGEVPHFVRWFSDHGYTIRPLPQEAVGAFEGEGDALFYGDVLLGGYRQRTEVSIYGALGAMLGVPVLPLELTQPHWYHLDTCLFPLGPDLLAYYPGAFGEDARRALKRLPGDKILLTEPDARRFGGNAVVVGRHVVLNTGCDVLADALHAHGFTVHPLDLSEFLLSGGSAKCLTLHLDHPSPMG